jgi:thiosulfate/3-mercaptopyruvate sulfurtransferase
MYNTISPIIQALELLNLIGQKDLIILDASSHKNAQFNYQQNHIQGALFIDLNTQLAEIKENVAIGGRHPLPSPQKFIHTISQLGITPQTHVVIYDTQNASNAAARCWWMLKAIGHQKLQVLDGGFNSALEYKLPINDQQVQPNVVDSYPINEWQLPLSDINEVEKVSQNKDYLVIDVRDNARFKGQTEPIDLIAGHIPGAINVPFSENLTQEGLFVDPHTLKLKYQNVLGKIKAEHVIVHCGSGVTACHTLLAMASANLPIPKLYVGSWSEWSRNNKPIATSLDE